MQKIIKNVIAKSKNRSKCEFRSGSDVDTHSEFSGRNCIGYDTHIDHCKFGYASYVAARSWLSLTSIGKYTCIASYVQTAIGRHPSRDFVAVHPAFFSMVTTGGLSYVDKSRFEDIHNFDDGFAIHIGNDVWIGENAIIFDGVTIGDGAIVGAGSIVMSNVEPYSIVTGIPAKETRKRFFVDEIQYLINLRWWDKDEGWIRKYSEFFNDVEKLISILENS